jgi:hypothetical protein
MTAPTYTFSADFTKINDQIRQMIGDVDVSTDPILSDEAIAFFYSLAGNDLLGGAVKAAKSAAAKLAREFDRDLDGLVTKRSQRHAAMLATIDQLESDQSAGQLDFTAPSVGTVKGNYPMEFESSDLSGPAWGEDE